ncbi:MAG: MgtC/SapB family protein [Burkholderiales bacterium]
MMDTTVPTMEIAIRFLTSLAVGLLLGLDRQKNPAAKAGLRTFALVALFGTTCGMLTDHLGTTWILIAGMLLVGAMVIGAYLGQNDPAADSGTTTIIALLLCYALGAMIWYGHRQLAVALAIVSTVLLHFKTELHGISERLKSQDIASILQFAALTFIVLPLLPDRGYGPYQAVNPYHVWLMVVLVSGVGLTGYLALRFANANRGVLLTGLLGGLISSTATTLVFSRQTRDHAASLSTSARIILLSNLMVPARLAVIIGIADFQVLRALLPAFLVSILLGGVAVYFSRSSLPVPQQASPSIFTNPTQIKVALGFGAIYATVLLLTAWVSTQIGALGFYAVAFVSGLTDVDAITLSSVQLAAQGRIPLDQAGIGVAAALIANILLKAVLTLAIGGRALAARCAPTLMAMTGGVLLGLTAF